MTNESIALISLASTIVVTISNVFLVIFTRWYVRLTAAMLDHMRDSETASVVLDITFDGHSAYLTIANRGTRAATSVVFEALTGFDWSQHGNLEALKERGLSYLPAGRSMRFWIGYPDWDKIKAEHPVVRIDIRYDVEGRIERRQFIIDMSQYLGTSIEGNPEDRIAEAIGRLADSQRDRGLFGRIGAFVDRKKRCSECAELIPAAAKLCSRCGTRQAEEHDDTAAEATPNSA